MLLVRNTNSGEEILMLLVNYALAKQKTPTAAKRRDNDY